MSVTYGAGGGTSDYTVKIASDLQENCGVTPLAHLTCVSSTREKVQQVLNELKDHKIENILALRGDIPQDGRTPQGISLCLRTDPGDPGRQEIFVSEPPATLKAMWSLPTSLWIWII